MADAEATVATAPAPGELAHPALALVNSRRRSQRGLIDELADRTTLARWLTAHGLAGTAVRVDSDALEAVRALREAVRELLLARIERRLPDPAALTAVNEASADAPTAPQLSWTEPDEPQWRRDCLGTASVRLARSRIAADAIELLTGPDHVRLRACPAPGCVRLMLTDHGRRQWCSTRCGDRVRASRYYDRHHARGSSEGEERS